MSEKKENDENVDDFESAMSEVEAIDQQILDIAEAILDPNLDPILPPKFIVLLAVFIIY